MEKKSKVNGEQIPLNSSRCEGIEEDENTIKILSVEHLTFQRYTWRIPEEKLSAMVGVDKWALSSCLMCHFGDFGDSNSPRSTKPFPRGSILQKV